MNILIDNSPMQFFIFKTLRYVWVKRFYTNTLLLGFFCWVYQFWKLLSAKGSLLKHMRKAQERRRLSVLSVAQVFAIWKEKKIDIQVYSRIGKAMKML